MTAKIEIVLIAKNKNIFIKLINLFDKKVFMLSHISDDTSLAKVIKKASLLVYFKSDFEDSPKLSKKIENLLSPLLIPVVVMSNSIQNEFNNKNHLQLINDTISNENLLQICRSLLNFYEKEKTHCLIIAELLTAVNETLYGVLCFDSFDQLILFNKKAEELTSMDLKSKTLTSSKFFELMNLSQKEIIRLNDKNSLAINTEILGNSINLKMMPLNSDDNNASGKLLILRDNTEADSERMKSAFLSVVSHELRTPLTVIKNVFEILTTMIHESLPPEQKNEVLNLGVKNSKRLSQIIDDLLDISLIESQTMELNYQAFDLYSLLKTIGEDYSKKYDFKNINFIQKIDAKLNSVPGDPERIKQILLKIISNAIKFSPTEAKIELKGKLCSGKEINGLYKDYLLPNTIPIEAKRKYAVISVKDEGVGIGKEDLNKIFLKFQQVEDIDTRKFQGIGLGLSIIKALIEKHDGTIFIKSEKDKGTAFIFTIPMLTSQELLHKIISEKVGAAARNNMNLLAISIQITNYPKLDKNLIKIIKNKLEKNLEALISHSLFRSSDAAYYNQKTKQMILVVTGSKKENAPKIVDRVINNLNTFLKDHEIAWKMDFITKASGFPEDASDAKSFLNCIFE
ncbi:MAG: ATP-binding protein [Pseudomonadota bacterium]